MMQVSDVKLLSYVDLGWLRSEYSVNLRYI